MRRHAEVQRLQLIQERANCRYETGARGIEQQSQCACQTEAKGFSHAPGQGIVERP
jgi:hypothetical protein